MRSRQAKLARETSPVYCHQLGFTTKFHPGSQSLASNRQGAQHQILRNAFKPAAAGFCGWDQGQEQVDRCHHRCRRKTFRTGHNHRPSTCSAWKTLFNQTTGSTTLASCLLACNQRILCPRDGLKNRDGHADIFGDAHRFGYVGYHSAAFFG